MGVFVLEPETTGLAGIAATTPASAWGFSAWVPIVEQSEVWSILCLSTVQTHAIPTADTTFEALLEIGTGLSGAEVTKVQIPFNCRADTNVGYYFPPVNAFLPEPFSVTAGTRISIRFADGLATAQSYSGARLVIDRITPAGPFEFGHRLNQAVNRASTY